MIKMSNQIQLNNKSYNINDTYYLFSGMNLDVIPDNVLIMDKLENLKKNECIDKFGFSNKHDNLFFNIKKYKSFDNIYTLNVMPLE
jgi:hypothetical protein